MARHAAVYADCDFLDQPARLALAANELVPFDDLIRTNRHLKFTDLLLEVRSPGDVEAERNRDGSVGLFLGPVVPDLQTEAVRGRVIVAGLPAQFVSSRERHS